MGVFYSFHPSLSKIQLDNFLNEDNIKYKSIKEEHRYVIELLDLKNINYLLFYYDDPNSLVAHSSHDLDALSILGRLKNKFNLKIESDNDEFVI